MQRGEKRIYDYLLGIPSGETQCRWSVDVPVSPQLGAVFHLDLTYIRLPLKSTDTKVNQSQKKLRRLLVVMKERKFWMGAELLLTLTDIIQSH